jgi:hypothetical protein
VRQLVDPPDVRDYGPRAAGLGHQIERHVIIVTNWR